MTVPRTHNYLDLVFQCDDVTIKILYNSGLFVGIALITIDNLI